MLARVGHPDLMDVGLGPWLHTLGDVVEDVGGLVKPATLFAGFSIDLAERRPESERSIADCQLGSERKSTTLEVDEEFVPTLLALAITIDNSNQLLLAIHRGPHQHEQTLSLIRLIFQANVDVDTVRPEVHVGALGEVATVP